MDYGILILEIILGLIFTSVLGLVTTWIDRKVTAKIQMRVGPPFLQPFYDIIKYMVKETFIPQGTSKVLFLAAPIIGFAGVLAASTILWRTAIDPSKAFVGDWIVVLYLLTMPALAVILGAISSRNPLASHGASREIKLLMAYELPFILCSLVPVIQKHSLQLGIISAGHAPFLTISGALAFVGAILCVQAKLAQVPFDMAEAETELAGGAFIEYSGPPLGIFKLTRALMVATMPVFLITLFCGGIDVAAGLPGIGIGFLKYVGIVVLSILIRNTAPRLRIDHAVSFFWGPVAIAAIAAVILALFGR